MSDKTVCISVIVPVYNAQDFLAETLVAIQQQTFTDFEVICVNDGSTDKSQEILEKFAGNDARFKVFRQENQGGSASRNYALDIAKGQYIAFCDHDDIYHPQYLEILYHNLRETDADISCCSYCKFVGRGGYNFKEYYELLPTYKFVTERPFIDKFCHKKKIGSLMWQKLYKAELLKNIRFSLKLPAINDMLFNIEVLLNSRKAVVCTQELLAYRQLETSQTLQKLSEKRIAEYQDLFAEIVGLGQRFPFVQTLLDKTATKYAYGMFVGEVLERYEPMAERALYALVNDYLQPIVKDKHFKFWLLGPVKILALWAFRMQKIKLLQILHKRLAK